jgi:hypothetical protein
VPAAKIKAPIKRPTINRAPLQQQPPPDEQQLPSFFSSDIDHPPFIMLFAIMPPFLKNVTFFQLLA